MREAESRARTDIASKYGRKIDPQLKRTSEL
jgi:hypothetical protein